MGYEEYDGYRHKVVPFLEQHKVNNIFVDSYLGTKLELKELGRLLDPNEQIVYITACKMQTDAGKKVLVCVTDARLLILNKGWVINKYQHSIFLDRISSTQRGRGFVFGTVVVNMVGNESPITLTGFWYKDTEQFIRLLDKARFDYEGRKYHTNNLASGYSSQQVYMQPNGYYGNGQVQGGYNQYDNYGNGYNNGYYGGNNGGYYDDNYDNNGGYYDGDYNQGYNNGYGTDNYKDTFDDGFEEVPEYDVVAWEEYERIEAQLIEIYNQGLIDRGTLEKRLRKEKVKLGLE